MEENVKRGWTAAGEGAETAPPAPAAAPKKREPKKKDVTNEIVTREYTINLHKRIHGV